MDGWLRLWWLLVVVMVAGFVVENSHDKDVLIRVWRDEKKKKPTVNVLGAAAPGTWESAVQSRLTRPNPAC